MIIEAPTQLELGDLTQRWRAGRDYYRPAGETIQTSAYEVAPIASDKIAKAFILEHHYSGSFPAARFRYGLYHQGELVGVAVFSVPCNPAALRELPGGEGVELGRFVLLDSVPANGETWFLARCFELLALQGIPGVVSFSDPMPRRSAGRVVFGGHLGTIYQAHNAVYLGRARADKLLLLPDGRTLHRRSLSKLRSGDKGWRRVAETLQAFGAEAPGEDLRAWADRWVPEITNAVRHPGNHKYAWTIGRRYRRHLPASLPYPKALAA